MFSDCPSVGPVCLSVPSVGAATTMVTEMIRAALDPADGIQLTEAESTLLALGIHADTGLKPPNRASVKKILGYRF